MVLKQMKSAHQYHLRDDDLQATRIAASDSHLNVCNNVSTLSLEPPSLRQDRRRLKRKASAMSRSGPLRIICNESPPDQDPDSSDNECYIISNPESDIASRINHSSLRLQDGMIMTSQSVVQYDHLRSKKIIEAYHVATQVLEDAASKTSTAYFTPYGNMGNSYVTPYGPPDVSFVSNAQNDKAKEDGKTKISHVTPEVASPGASAQDHSQVDRFGSTQDPNPGSASEDPEYDHAQAERLILLAGGDSLTDDDNTDDEIEVLASFTRAQPDRDVESIVKHVLATIVSRDEIGPYQAVDLQNTLNQGGLVKNLIIPKEQSQATSRFYATLASHAQGSSRPSCILTSHHGNSTTPVLITPSTHQSIKPNGHSHQPTSEKHGLSNAVGNSTGFSPPTNLNNANESVVPSMVGNQLGILVPPGFNVHGRLIPTGHMTVMPPETLAQELPFVPSNMPPPPIPSRVGTARGKTIEEAKKVRDYGFPPLPSSRPGR